MKRLAPCSAAGLAAAGTLSLSALAQPVALPPVQVSVVPIPGLTRNGEPTIVASTLNPNEVLVAWIRHTAVPVGFRIEYRVSTDGFAGNPTTPPSELPDPSSQLGGCAPCPVTNSADPAVARSRVTGDLFLGALFDGVQGRALSIARKPLGASDLEGSPPIVRQVAPCLAGIDRPSMAAGPRPPGESPTAPDRLYFTYHLPGPQPQPRPMYSARSVAASPIGSTWACQPTIPPSNNGYPSFIASGDSAENFVRSGVGNPGVVIHSGARAGRLIVASCLSTTTDPLHHISTQAPPEITWTDEGGGPVIPSPFHNPWAAARALNGYGVANSVLAGVRDIVGNVPVPADVAFQFQSAPSIATDPNSPSDVYVAFIARSTADTPDQVDPIIAWTNTGNDPLEPPQFNGPVFQGQTSPPNTTRRTYRILDSWLVIPGDPPLSTHQAEQFQPAVVIDDLGGINLLFCQTFECVTCQPAPPSTVSVRYARWPSRAALDAGEPPILIVLSLPSEPWGATSGHDYQGITSAGCLVYAAWASNHTGEWHVYVSQIRLCPADADGSGLVNAADPAAFNAAYLAQQAQADVNRDGVINPQDYSDFMAAYACGACPIP